MYVDNPLGQPNPELQLCDLSSGDPTVRTHEFNNVLNQEVQSLLLDPQTYYWSEAAERQAKKTIVALHSGADFSFAEEDIFITQGGETALTYGLRALCSAGDNFIVPNPGYWHLNLTAPCLGVECRMYGFSGTSWTIDFKELEAKIDAKTRFILVVSPGNPNCVFYDYPVMQRFLDLAEKHGLVLFSDEIYLRMYHDKREHISPLQLASTAPVLVMSGLAKLAGVPGFGFEWLALKDPQCKATRLRENLAGLLTSLGSQSSCMVRVFPALLQTQLQLLDEKNSHIKSTYALVKRVFGDVPGIELCESTAAMFATLRILPGFFPPSYEDDLFFCKELFNRHALKLGRGTFNGEKGLIRISLVLYEEEYVEGAKRLREFVSSILSTS